MSSKEDFQSGYRRKLLAFGLLGRKDRRTKIENLYSCRCECKLGESKTDKAFTQLNIIYIFESRKARETPGKFVALVIVLRLLLVNKNWSLIKNAHALYHDNGPLIQQ